MPKALLPSDDVPFSHTPHAHVAPRRSFITRRRWTVDSGASVNVVSSIETLDQIDPAIPSIIITTMDGNVVKSEAAGPCSVRVVNPFNRKVSIIHLKRAYYVAGAAFNLFSIQGGQ